MDVKEVKLPETFFVRDIETKVFQSIIFQGLRQIGDISLGEATLIDNLLGREGAERVSGIYVEQDLKNHTVSVKVEVNIVYGVSIPEKAEEIQIKIAQDISQLTGLHVSVVHVVFKNLILREEMQEDIVFSSPEGDYSEKF